MKAEGLMKLICVICMAVALLCTPAFLMAASCDSEAGYYVTFTFEDENYSVSVGFSDVDTGEAFATVNDTEGVGTFIFGTNVASSSTTWNLPTDSIWVLLLVENNAAGNYQFGADSIQAYLGMYGQLYSAFAGNIVITSFGEIGETIEGTFSLRLDNYSVEGSGFHSLADLPFVGYFRVKRVEDNVVLPF
jgi:hypothetical protein